MHLSRLRSGDVDPQDLVFRKKARKRLEEYDVNTHTKAAMLRYHDHGIDRNLGQGVRYVVVDDDTRKPERVRRPFEEPESYDATVYAQELILAGESIVSPLGGDRKDTRRYLRGFTDSKLGAYIETAKPMD